jgi:NADPH-dependent curcumin reductase CurA
MRIWITGVKTYFAPVNIGDTMPALCVAQVLFSRSDKFNEGDLVTGLFGWEKYAIRDAK